MARPKIVERRWWALGAVSLSVLAVGIDGTVLSVALPTLAVKLRASESDLQWFSSAYLLVLAAAMLPAGLLADRYGRRVMVAGLVLFGIGSVGCAVSTSSVDFIAARVLLGVAGAGLIVLALSSLTNLFAESERPRAVAVWAAANFLSLPVGPILGGYLLTYAWWGWVFLINVPVVIVGLIAVWRLIPPWGDRRSDTVDGFGVASSVTGLVALTYGLIEAGQHGWGDPAALACLGAGLVLLAGFVVWERHLGAGTGPRPLIDPALFRSRAYTWGVILIAIAVTAMMGVLFTLPQYFQGVTGADPMGSGLRLLPLVGGLTVGAIGADQITGRLGAKLTAALGLSMLAVGLACGSATTTASTASLVSLWTAVVGAGMGLSLATASSVALSELTPEYSGIGSAVLQALNKTSGPLGAAVFGSVLSAGYLAQLHLSSWPAAARQTARQSIFGALSVAQRAHSPWLVHYARTAFTHGLDRSLLVATAIAGAGALLALLFLPARANHPDRPPHPPQTTIMCPAEQRPPAGLRERKKAKTRASIQSHAIRLFSTHGYHATTVDQIAEAAEVSQSTFFRYFPTKEDVVLHDRYDPVLLAAFHAQPAEVSPVQALRQAISDVLGQLPAEDLKLEQTRAGLIFTVPELRGRFMDQVSTTVQMIAEAIAVRIGGDPGDFAVRNFAGALVGVALVAVTGINEDPGGDYLTAFDRGLEHLEAGLPLEWQPTSTPE